jgi:protein-S-isoprenylcysteine O-methyltransferase Ste14
MSAFVIQMLVVMFIGKNARNRSHVPGDVRKNHLERYTGSIANALWLLALGYSTFLPLQLGTIWLYVGLFVYAIGLMFLTIATFNFIKATPNSVITSGIYGFSRHPMYLAIFLICLGSGITAASPLFIFITIILGFCLHREALIEERFCLNEYGSTYQQYLDRVPRWIGLPKIVK